MTSKADMEPNSNVLLVLLFVGAVGALVAFARWSKIYVRLATGLIAMVLCSLAGIALVNDYYGYYQTWSQMSADLSGKYDSFSTAAQVTRTESKAGTGRIEAVMIPGRLSGMRRGANIYLPPQYGQPAYAHTAFPVIELLHGTPGSPSAWLVHLNIAATMDNLIAQHKIGPAIVVMPTMSVGRTYQECVDAPGALDDTYVTQDVRSFVIGKYRASSVPAEWAVGGYSSGGYCAANLALRHRAMFGAAGIMDGYFRPQDGPAAKALHNNPAAMAANDPLLAASQLPSDVSPLPAFWLAAGTGSKADIRGALAFANALHGVAQVPLYREADAGHNFYAWQPAVPHMLAWMWTQISTPELKTQFPIAGGILKTDLAAPGAARSANRSSAAPGSVHNAAPSDGSSGSSSAAPSPHRPSATPTTSATHSPTPHA